MAVIAGRTNRLYVWNAFDWSNTYRYVAAGWTVTPTPGTKDASVALAVPTAYNVTGAKKGVIYGLKSSQGYDRRSAMVDVATGSVRLSELQSGTTYYVVPIALTAGGELICGPQQAPLVTS